MAKLDRTFHALADPTRRAILSRLAEGEASVADLARPHAMALQSVLKHLAVLEEGGLIVSRKQGRTRLCRLSEAALAPVEAWLDDQRRLWEGRSDRLAAFVTRGDDP